MTKEYKISEETNQNKNESVIHSFPLRSFDNSFLHVLNELFARNMSKLRHLPRFHRAPAENKTPKARWRQALSCSREQHQDAEEVNSRSSLFFLK